MPASCDRFFARLRGFDIECPGCGAVQSAGLEDQPEGFNDRTQLFRCWRCGLVLHFGLFAFGPSPTVSALSCEQMADPSTQRWVRSLGGSWLAAGGCRAVPSGQDDDESERVGTRASEVSPKRPYRNRRPKRPQG